MSKRGVIDDRTTPIPSPTSKAHTTEHPLSAHVLGNLPTAVALARIRARDTFAIWSVAASNFDAVELVVSELVANALQHTHSTSDKSAWLSLRLIETDVLIEVFDTSPRMPQLIRVSEWDERGRGLQLVTALSSGWGATPVVVDGEQVGKRVWARVPVHAATSAETRA